MPPLKSGSNSKPATKEGTLSTDALMEKKKRKGGPKVKSGCVTCKLRRVKCDEHRPVCKRCGRFGVQCDGYPNKVEKVKPKPAIRAIVPKNVVPEPTLLVHQIRRGPDFSGEDEARYFRYYCEDVAPQLSGPYETALWDRIIPQAVESEPIIRHAVIAVAALNKSRVAAGVGKAAKSNPHHQFALLQYGKALKKIRENLEDDFENPRRSLMACALVFCLESMQGFHISASSHASVAVTLLGKWCAKYKGTYAHYHTIEPDICHGLSELDLQSLMFLNNRPTSVHREMCEIAQDVFRIMPLILPNLHYCFLYWQLIMKHCWHFMAAAQGELSSEELFEVSGTTDTSAFTDFPRNNTWCVVLEPPATLQRQRDACLENIRRWEVASQGLMEEALNAGNLSDDYLLAAMIRIHVAMTKVGLGGTFLTNEMGYDRYINEYNTIVSHAEPIVFALAARDKGSKFVFNLGILPALCQVGMRCRQKDIRGRAIDLLLSCPNFSEGCWQSGSIGQWTHRLRVMEERGADEDGVVAESKRILLPGSSISMYQNISQVRWTQWSEEMGQLIETDDGWSRWSDGFRGNSRSAFNAQLAPRRATREAEPTIKC
ncbi:hypothetical protein BKA64DRAFT_701349 [Cadophora sp. MPI-SDFR-AT-0126]|nr:hypothetical protein BKA64DRAFT_701349 [Leotiomycetes sp. MPI-SDFR-AT-0126]